MMESVGTQIILKSYDGSVCICVDDHGVVIARVSDFHQTTTVAFDLNSPSSVTYDQPSPPESS